MLSLALIFILLIIFLTQNRINQFYIFVLSVLFPFTFGHIKSVPHVLIVEWLTVVFFLFNMNDLISLKSVYRNKKIIDFSGTRILIFGLILLIIAAGYSFANNELFATNTVSGAGGVSRTYFSIINNILIFFTTCIFIYNNYNELDIEKLLKIIVVLSIILGIVRVFTFLYKIDVFFLAGSFNYNPRIGRLPMRLPSLERVSAVGIPAILALRSTKNSFKIFSLLMFTIFIFLNGGRTFFVGIFLTLTLYMLFVLKGKSIYFILLIGLLTITATIALPEELLEKQIERMLSFEGGFKQQDSQRHITYMYYIQNFLENPILGKGIKEFMEFIPLEDKELLFVKRQQHAGGHGSYISLLSTFGIIGLMYFLIFLGYGIILALKKVRYYIRESTENFETTFALFLFLALVLKCIYSLTSYNGFADRSLFLLVGLIAGLRIFENKNIS